MERWEKWRPATCGCVIEEKYLDNVLTGERRYITKCEFHESSNDPNVEVMQEQWILRDAQIKSFEAAPALLVQEPDLRKWELQEVKGDIVFAEVVTPGQQKLRDGVEFFWMFDSNRKLHTTFTGIDAAEKQAIEDKLSAELPNIGFIKVDGPNA